MDNTESDTKPNHINRGLTIDADFRIKSSGTLLFCFLSELVLLTFM